MTLQFERLRRVGQTTSTEESSWLEVINRPLVEAERFAQLSAKWEAGTLTNDESSELQSILSEREAQNVERAEAIQRLSELTGVPFLNLWRQLIS